MDILTPDSEPLKHAEDFHEPLGGTGINSEGRCYVPKCGRENDLQASSEGEPTRLQGIRIMAVPKIGSRELGNKTKELCIRIVKPLAGVEEKCFALNTTLDGLE